MRQITRQITLAFRRGERLRVGNSFTDGCKLYLHGNLIAHRLNGRIWINNAGWATPTTKERLNALPDVHIVQRRGEWYLNGQPWDGDWICPSTDRTNYFDELLRAGQPTPEPMPEAVEFDLTSEWKGKFNAPIYGIFHTNTEAELRPVEDKLSAEKIEHRRYESDTEGEYKPNYFIVVRPEDVDKAKNILQ